MSSWVRLAHILPNCSNWLLVNSLPLLSDANVLVPKHHFDYTAWLYPMPKSLDSFL